MGTHKGLRRAATLLACGGLVAVVACLDSTEVTLVLTTDIPCTAQHGTSIAVGSPDDVTTSAPATVTPDCTLGDPSGDLTDGGSLAVPAEIGSLVVVPSGNRSGTFAVQIVTAVDPILQPSDCVAPQYQGCIVARRQVSFIPHTPLTLPIEMTLDCLSVYCSANLTCFHGACVTVDTACTGANCTPDLSTADASTGDASSSGADGATEDGHDATTSTRDALAADVTESDVASADGPSGVVPDEASTAEASTVDASPDAPDESPHDAGPEASTEDAAPEASIHDAAPEVGPVESGSPEASTPPPSDSGSESDGNPIGSCPGAGPSSGVECAGSRCTGGEICCVSYYPTGGSTMEQCLPSASCNYNGSTLPVLSALACRNSGDCAAGKVCCVNASSTGNGSISQCATSCPFISTAQRTACTNSCECTGAQTTCNALPCFGYSIGFCGGTGGSSCP